MSQISSTPRRPSTAHSALLTTRMPYEAGEALLWERQNHRVHAHLSIQMKELQTRHDAYDARIQATESITEAAEAAVHKVKQMEAKIAAMEADDKDRPFDAWAKEAISQFQVFVDSHKGVRQKLSGLEQRLDDIGEDVEGVRDTAGLLRDVVRRLEVLEDEKREEGEKLKTLEREVERLRSARGRQESVGDEVEPDDNPLHVFYGIDTQTHHERRDHSPKRNDRRDDDRKSSRHERSPEQQLSHRDNDTFPGPGDLQPPDEDTLRPTEAAGQSSDLPEAAPGFEYGWENTRQFKDMQEELAALRAMCRTQEPKSSGQTADATQRPQDTIPLPREPNLDFSDATTETEAEYNSPDRHRGHMGVANSDMHMPSSPPKRHDTQSARRNLMKRPSIYDPRVPSINEHRQSGQPAPDPRSKIDHHVRPSLLTKLPVETQVVDDRVSAKRKRVEDAPTQRVTRPKLTDSRATVQKPTVPAAKNITPAARSAFAESAPLAISDDASIPVLPTRKTDGRQKPAANAPLHQAAHQSSPKKYKQPVMSVAKPTVSVAETVKSRKAISKPKPAASAATQQQPPSEAGPSSSKQAPATVKREAKSARQPPGACKSCRSRHQKCDRTHPTCARCAKLGSPCEYPQASEMTVPAASSPRKKQALLPIPAPAKDSNREHGLRETSVTVSPEAPRHKGPAKRQMPASPSKKSVATTAPTAASARAPRAKKAPVPRASPTKKK